LILGILGTIGGPVTLFKGLDEMQQLAFSQVFSVSDYLLFAVIKLARWWWRPPAVSAVDASSRRSLSASRWG
jgi:hypothetical protein